MLTPAEAQRQILEAMPAFAAEPIDVASCVGRVLQQTVTAERDQPPFDRVTMDGIAIAFAAFDRGRRSFRIAATRHAGDPVQALTDADTCIEVMTGTSLPEDADTVIPVERITVTDGEAAVDAGYRPESGQFVHRQGSDHRQGTVLFETGSVITPVDIAVLVSCGLDRVRVARSPKIRVISTGNELVPAGKPIAAHQIRLSNGPAVVAMLGDQAFRDACHSHLPDEPELLTQRIGEALDDADVLILSGGVSMGKADFVPGVLAGLGVRVVFHRIAQRPGKPMWFGRGPKDQVVFALPGNPVSTLVCCRQYVLPALFAAGGRRPRELPVARLETDVVFDPKLTYFLPARTRSTADGELIATPVPTNTSGDFTSLSGTDGYVELDADCRLFPAGTPVPFHGWRTP